MQFAISRIAPCILGCLALLGAITPREGSAEDLISIVTTTSDLASIAQAVGGDRVEVEALSTGTQDPHFISAKPSYMTKAHNAGLWIRMGLELEVGYEPLILRGARNNRIHIGQPGHLDVSEGVERLEVPTTLQIDRSMGDVHGMGNPHYQSDPFNGRIIATNICKRLCQLDPAHADTYKANHAAFLDRLDRAMFGDALVQAAGADALWAAMNRGKLETLLARYPDATPGGWWAQMQPYQGAKVVTYHKSWPYFARRFGLDIVGQLEPKPGIPPSPRHLIDLAGIMQAEGAKLILMRPFYSRKAPDLLAEKTGASVLVVADSVGGQPEAIDYISMLNNLVTRISSALAS